MSKKLESYFSRHENDIIKIIGRKKKTINEITAEFFKEDTLEGNNYVAGVVRRVVRKCEHYKLPWSITGEGAGKHGRTVWRIKVGRS